MLTGCTSNANKLVIERWDGNTGHYEVKNYSGFYNAYDWLEEGKSGFELWVDHDKKVSPILSSLQRAEDMKAEGILTFYFVNLEPSTKSLIFTAVKEENGATVPMPLPKLQIRPRSHTSVKLGSIPIPNYRTSLNLFIQFKVDGIQYERQLVVKRLMDSEVAQYSGRIGLPPYPWFKAPHYPFVPPLSQNYQ